MAFVFGGALAGLMARRVPRALTHGALTALIVGILMVMVRELQDGVAVNHMKIGIKLVISLAVCFFAYRAEKRDNPDAARPDLIAAASLTAVNVAIATIV